MKEKENEGIKVGMIYCYSKYIYPKTQRVVKKDFENLPIKEHMIQCIAATSWWLCPKNALLEVGGFDNVSSHQDANLILKLLKNKYAIFRVSEILLNYYVHDGEGITKINKKWINDDIEYRNKCRESMQNLNIKDRKDIEYSFSERIANMAIIIGDKKIIKEEILNLLKIYPIKKDTIKTISKYLFRPLYIKELERKKKRR